MMSVTHKRILDLVWNLHEFMKEMEASGKPEVADTIRHMIQTLDREYLMDIKHDGQE